jgi:hypothetical protein
VSKAAALHRFELEFEMARPVEAWLLKRGLTVKREFQVPWGICDLVAVKLNQKKIQKRISNGQLRPIASPLRLYILSKIPDLDESDSSITLHELWQKSFAYLPREIIEDELARLIRSRFVTSPRRSRFQKINGWAPLHSQIVAVELKLSRISDVLAQASSNRAFATESYVALPAVLAKRIAEGPRADEFKLKGVGLLAVYKGTCRRLLQSNAAPEVSDEILQAHCVERFWRSRDS